MSMLKQLSCPNCGAALSQIDPGAQTIVCPTCGSYVAVGMGDPEVTGKSRKLPKSPVPVQIGKTITVDGVRYLVMGRVMYRGWDDEDNWQWNEWMLGAEDGRMLWLSYDEKGFSLFTKKRFREQFNAQSSRVLQMGEQRIPIRERYPAKIIGAEGELTWRPKEDDRLYMAEGARGGLFYSIQQSDKELEVYEGRILSEKAIAQAFNDDAWVKRVERREQIRGTRRLIGGLCVIFAFIGLAIALMTSAIGETTETQTIPLTTTGATLPVEFEQSGRPSAVQMSLITSLSENTFVDVDVNMIAPDGTESYLFSQSFWHETGYDEDGFWRETDYNGSGIFVPLEGGLHQLQIVVEDATYTGDLSAQVTLKRNIIMSQWFVGYAIVVGVIGVLFWMSVPNKHVT